MPPKDTMMTGATRLRRFRLVTVLLAAILSPACATLGSHPGQINVTSEPAGAEVYVMGEKLGVTPLTVNQNAVFPPAFPAEKQALYGNIELRKPGCKDSVQPVSTRVLAKGVHIRLECEGGEGGSPAALRQAEPGASMESRLRRVQELRDKGLITDQEARDIRQRLLNEL